MQTALAVERTAWWQKTWNNEVLQRMAIFAASLACALVLWTLLAWWVDKPPFLPSPIRTFEGAVELIGKGELQADVAVSFARIIVGFALGTLIGIPLGLLMGMSPLMRTFMDPYVEFF